MFKRFIRHRVCPRQWQKGICPSHQADGFQKRLGKSPSRSFTRKKVPWGNHILCDISYRTTEKFNTVGKRPRLEYLGNKGPICNVRLYLLLRRSLPWPQPSEMSQIGRKDLRQAKKKHLKHLENSTTTPKTKTTRCQVSFPHRWDGSTALCSSHTFSQPLCRQIRGSGLFTPENCRLRVIVNLLLQPASHTDLRGRSSQSWGWFWSPGARCWACTQQHPVSLMLGKSSKKTQRTADNGCAPTLFPEAFNSLNRKWVLSSWKINHYPLPLVNHNRL